MDRLRRIFLREAAALRPPLACEIMPSGVAAARRGAGNREILSAFAHLRPGLFFPRLKAPIFSARASVASALRQALDEIGPRDTKLTLIVPDASVRVLLLDFDSLPAKPAEAMPILRFRLRKLIPFEVEDAAVSYQRMPGKDAMVRTVAAVMPAAILAEYESAVREAGYEPAVVLPSTMAALAALDGDEPSLVVNRNAGCMTTAITRQNELLLHRTLDLAHVRDATTESAETVTEEWAPGEDSRHAIEELRQTEELRQAVSVAIAYFEDTLGAPPRELLSSGPGGAEELIRLLGDATIPARDLVSAQAVGATTSMPRGILAGVLGALAS